MGPIFLDTINLLGKVRNALENNLPLSIVRIGDGENIVLAQDVILPRKKYMKTSVGKKWPEHGSGVRLPDPVARDLVVHSLKNANIIGILPYNDQRISAPQKYKRDLTDKVFEFHNIEPKETFDACLFRDLLTTTEFWETMRGKKLLIISKWGHEFRSKVQPYEKAWGFTIVGTLAIENFYGIDQVMEQLEGLDFEVALLAAGVGSIVIAQRIADQHGKVAIDVGKGLSLIALGMKAVPLPVQSKNG